MSSEKPIDPLTILLAELPKVRERSFTEGVLYRLHLRELRRRVVFFTAWSCGFAGIVLSLPLERLVASLTKLLQDSNSKWMDYSNAGQITLLLDDYPQMSNFNLEVALIAGAVILVLGTFALLQD